MFCINCVRVGITQIVSILCSQFEPVNELDGGVDAYDVLVLLSVFYLTVNFAALVIVK